MRITYCPPPHLSVEAYALIPFENVPNILHSRRPLFLNIHEYWSGWQLSSSCTTVLKERKKGGRKTTQTEKNVGKNVCSREDEGKESIIVHKRWP